MNGKERERAKAFVGFHVMTLNRKKLLVKTRFGKLSVFYLSHFSSVNMLIHFDIFVGVINDRYNI